MRASTLRGAGLTLMLFCLGATRVLAGPGAEPRMLLHLVQATGKTPTCGVPIEACADVKTFGLVTGGGSEFNYYCFVLVTGYDREQGLGQARIAVDFDRTTGSGVDTYSWTLCATSSENPLDWYNSLAGNTITWDDCPKTEFAVAGYFYMAAYDPSRLALIPPENEDARLTPCGGTEVLVPATRLGIASFAGDTGCNPCLEECHHVAVESRSWSGIKALFHPGR